VSVQFPAIEPFESGLLDVGDGHEVYWESRGNPAGTPALFLHGGPGMPWCLAPERVCCAVVGLASPVTDHTAGAD